MENIDKHTTSYHLSTWWWLGDGKHDIVLPTVIFTRVLRYHPTILRKLVDLHPSRASDDVDDFDLTEPSSECLCRKKQS